SEPGGRLRVSAGSEPDVVALTRDVERPETFGPQLVLSGLDVAGGEARRIERRHLEQLREAFRRIVAESAVRGEGAEQAVREDTGTAGSLERAAQRRDQRRVEQHSARKTHELVPLPVRSGADHVDRDVVLPERAVDPLDRGARLGGAVA